MKKHIPLFMLCGAFFFASCDDSTTKNEENNEAAYYEMSFHKFALENENEDAQNKLDQTKQEIEKNCKGDQDQSEICQELRKRRDSLESLIDNKQSQIEILKKRFVKIDPPDPDLPPVDPNPNPCPVGNCMDFSNIYAIYIGNDLEKIDFRVLNQNGELVGGLGKAIETNENFTKYPLEIDATGLLFINVDKYSTIFETEVNYEIQGFISKDATKG